MFQFSSPCTQMCMGGSAGWNCYFCFYKIKYKKTLVRVAISDFAECYCSLQIEYELLKIS